MTEPHFLAFFNFAIECCNKWFQNRQEVRELYEFFRDSIVEFIVIRDTTYRLVFKYNQIILQISSPPKFDGFWIQVDRDDAERAIYDGYIDMMGFFNNKYKTNMDIASLGRFRGLLSAIHNEFEML